jgi:hypothetical protein
VGGKPVDKLWPNRKTPYKSTNKEKTNKLNKGKTQ